MPMFQRKEELSVVSGGEITDTGQTVVGKSVKLEGDFSSDENVRIDGSVSGTVKTSQNLEVGAGAVVEADVFAENASVAGQVNGNLDIQNKLELQASAKITGDIKAGVLEVAAGASFTGQCEMNAADKKEVEPVKEDTSGEE
jgi:cytoskeletal protein CcmA (bactofilin family)